MKRPRAATGYGEWTPDGDGAHSALCQQERAANTLGTAACESLRLAADLAGESAAYDFAFCPVCGEVNDGARLFAGWKRPGPKR